MSPTKSLTIGLIVGCLGVGTYAALGPNLPASATGVPATAEPVVEQLPAGHPPTDHPAPQSDAGANGPSIAGTVEEIIQVAAYTYLRLKQQDGSEVWAAVEKAAPEKGMTVQLTRAERMENFSSKQLGRTFPVIYFGSLALGPAEQAANPHASVPGQRSGRGEAADLVKVLPAEKAGGQNGYKIADLFEKRDQLHDSKVRVRGTVVQVTMNVMNTNFVHIRDGSGDAASKNHDIVLKLSANPPNVGEEALFEGVLKKDVDLGAGYSYPALLETASVIQD